MKEKNTIINESITDIKVNHLQKEGFIGKEEEFQSLIDYCTAHVPNIFSEIKTTNEKLELSIEKTFMQHKKLDDQVNITTKKKIEALDKEIKLHKQESGETTDAMKASLSEVTQKVDESISRQEVELSKQVESLVAQLAEQRDQLKQEE